MKVLLSGGFGFIGKNLIERLYEKYEIVVIDKYLDQGFQKHYPKIKTYIYNVVIENRFKEILNEEKPDYIINLLSIVTASRDFYLFAAMIDTNIKVLLNLYESSRVLKNLRLFINFGTAEEYGNIEPPFREDQRESPNSPYAIAKQMATNTAIMLYDNYQFPIMVVRPGNLFGKYQDREKFINYVINKLIRNEVIETTFGEQRRDFIYIEDLTCAIEKIIDNHQNAIGKIVNVSYGKSTALKEILEYLKQKTKSESKILYGKIPYRANEIMDFRCDITLLKEITGINFKYDLFSGLDEYLNLLRVEKR